MNTHKHATHFGGGRPFAGGGLLGGGCLFSGQFRAMNSGTTVLDWCHPGV